MTMVSFFRFDLKSESGKFEFACIKCNLSFKMTNGLSNAHASAWWKEAQQLQPVWLLKQADLPVAHSANTTVQQP